ncbi:MAG: NosD domain-containing protein [Actinomycetota bacterium]
MAHEEAVSGDGGRLRQGAVSGPDRVVRFALGSVALGLVILSFFLPIWHATLSAPQYPNGLRTTAYGDRIGGDVGEISDLNHYVGMRPVDLDDFPELAAWLPTVVLGAVAVVMATVFTGWPARLARIAIWLIPVGVLSDIQFRLYQYGHTLDPAAPLRLKPFTPWVIGPTKVFNFTTWSRPGVSLLAILGAAALLSFGPRVVRKLRSGLGASAVVSIAIALAVAGVIPAFASAPDDVAAGRDLARRLAKATPGATILIEPGVYQGTFVVDRPLILSGRGRAVLVGDGVGTVLTVAAPGAVVRGVTVRNSGPGPVDEPSGIRIEGDGVRIEDVRVEDSYMGIFVAGTRGARIERATIVGRKNAVVTDSGHAVGVSRGRKGPVGRLARGDGIALINSTDALVRDSRIDAVRDGIYIVAASRSMIDRNVITDARYAVHSMYARGLVVSSNRMRGNLSGAVVMYGGDVLLLDNTMRAARSPSTGFGVLLKDVAGADVAKNVIVGNRVGIYVDGPAGAPVEETKFMSNTVGMNDTGVVLFSTSPATFAMNSFVGNSTQVVSNGGELTSEWVSRGAGNYWGDYRGYDIAGDGFGDLPHREGSAIATLTSRAPLLGALASSPGLRLAAAVWERWAQIDPLVVDEIPLSRPVSPRFVSLGTRSEAPNIAMGAAGVLSVVFATWMLVRMRRISRLGRTPGTGVRGAAA